MADQFFHDVRPDPPRHLGLPRTSDLIHPTFRMVTTQSCRCTEGDEFDEKVVLINIAFPRISLQNSINEYLDSATMPRCRHCNQFRREVTRRRLIHATPVIAVAFQRVSYETGQRIPDLAAIDSFFLNFPTIQENVPARYELISAIQYTGGVHFVSLLRSRNGRFVRVSDNHPPTVAGCLDFRRTEIFLFRCLLYNIKLCNYQLTYEKI